MHAIGVDIGGTKIGIGVVNDHGEILASTKVKTDAQDAESINRDIATAVNMFAEDYEIGAVGVAAAGFIASDRKTVSFAPNIAWRNYPLSEKISELITIDVPVIVENDANAAGWAEYRFGAGRDSTDMLMLTIGTGLGGAIISDGQLLRGKHGVAAELGHVRLVP
ncbi:MAG: ROK family protein, partial [Cellulomonadaceae bacterium]|nr:ROK family protein [Cellulomonadaceae bacterium]